MGGKDFIWAEEVIGYNEREKKLRIILTTEIKKCLYSLYDAASPPPGSLLHANYFVFPKPIQI